MPETDPEFYNDEAFSAEMLNLDEQTREKQRELKTKLHDITDELLALPAAFPERDLINGLVGAAARLLDRTGKRDGRISDVRGILERHLPSVGLDIKDNEKTGL